MSTSSQEHGDGQGRQANEGEGQEGQSDQERRVHRWRHGWGEGSSGPVMTLARSTARGGRRGSVQGVADCGGRFHSHGILKMWLKGHMEASSGLSMSRLTGP